ncbi:uncharacterized protein LOC133285098 [Gastrolobium bilobum]|uniref:uncharacterized protein LOC133285098 n=1 Tax=Gastrolobium bilobum TaxID=150636 RepID=UPI002AB0330C|nr:uncharacterized protein LOC133285098 [Gastrolobium bilobum]
MPSEMEDWTVDKFVQSNGDWNWSLINQFAATQSCEAIANIMPPTPQDGQDVCNMGTKNAVESRWDWNQLFGTTTWLIWKARNDLVFNHKSTNQDALIRGAKIYISNLNDARGGAQSSCGGAFRDDAGRWVAGFSRNLGRGSALRAEIWGLLSGIEMAWDLGCRKLWIEGDSKVAINLITSGCDPCHPVAALIKRINSLLQRM